MGRRPNRAAAKQAAAALKNTPQSYDEIDDDDTPNVPTSEVGTPQPDDEDADGDEDVAGEDEGEGTPAQESSAPPSAQATPQPEGPPRKRRLGRPPKIKPPGWDDPDPNDDGTDRGTPNKRGRRGGAFGRGGGRWKNRGGPSHVTQQPIDKEGNMMNVVNDEVDLPEDAEGETKVDKLGHLQGDRDYRCRTFKVLGRGDRLYMLSTEPARCVGFRDSYLFFAKHKRLFKIIIDDEEKRDLIERELIPHSYKGRAIGIVTARSVFREFGAQIIVGGKRIMDDYEVSKAKLEGVVEGELADPNDNIKPGEPYNKNQYVAWHGASSVYHTGQPTVPTAAGKIADSKKRRIIVNDQNWMIEHAREASRFNSSLAVNRRRLQNGVYEPHTNTMQYPRTMQPTHAKWEPVPLTTTQGVEHATSENILPLMGHETGGDKESIFTHVDHLYRRNFLTVDTVYENPPYSGLGVPGLADDFRDMGFNGLASVTDEVYSELPEECKNFFDEALAKEKEWKSKWSNETVDQMRKPPIIDKGLIM